MACGDDSAPKRERPATSTVRAMVGCADGRRRPVCFVVIHRSTGWNRFQNGHIMVMPPVRSTGPLTLTRQQDMAQADGSASRDHFTDCAIVAPYHNAELSP